MGYIKGFTDVIKLDTHELLTVGDVTYGKSKTDIQIKTRASKMVRSIPGMVTFAPSFTILAGTDPEDNGGGSGAFDGYAALKNAFENDLAVKMTFGDESPEWFEILSFETSAPVDDVKSATVTFALSGIGAPSSSGS